MYSGGTCDLHSEKWVLLSNAFSTLCISVTECPVNVAAPAVLGGGRGALRV